MYKLASLTVLALCSRIRIQELMFGGMGMELDWSSSWVRLEGEYTEYSPAYIHPPISTT